MTPVLLISVLGKPCGDIEIRQARWLVGELRRRASPQVLKPGPASSAADAMLRAVAQKDPGVQLTREEASVAVELVWQALHDHTAPQPYQLLEALKEKITSAIDRRG